MIEKSNIRAIKEYRKDIGLDFQNMDSESVKPRLSVTAKKKINLFSDPELMGLVLKFCKKNNMNPKSISLKQIKDALSLAELKDSKISNIFKICTDLQYEFVETIVSGTSSIDEIYRNRNFIKKFKDSHIPIDPLIDILLQHIDSLKGCNTVIQPKTCTIISIANELYKKEMLTKSNFKQILNHVSEILPLVSGRIDTSYENFLHEKDLSSKIVNGKVSIGIIEY